MAVNQNHTVNRHGAVIPYGESVLKQCKDVVLSFPHQPGESDLFRGTKKGTLFLTSFRVIFLTLHSVSNPMLSFMMPFNLIRDCTVEQPLFAPNYIKGTITAAPGGGWEGQATFKLSFRKGGAIEFSQLMTQAAAAAILYGPTPIRPPPMEYGAPSSVRYETPPLGYGTQPMQHEAPPVGYEAPPSEYGAPPAGYTAPPVGYEAPPPGYEVPSAVYETLPTGNEAPPLRYEAPPPEYGAPSVGYRAQSQRYRAAQPPGHEAFLPSASSQAHFPPPRM
nr:postacrosomal sheath WW domain-binding protein isoform X2 [Loxodonta africana]